MRLSSAFCLLAFVGCSSSPSEAERLLTEGEALFYRALGGEKELRDEAILTLEQGLALQPDDPRGSLMYGMALLSSLAEDFDHR